MSLTTGIGPFAAESHGHFDVSALARPLIYWEPFAKRFRVVVGGVDVADSRDVLALHETGELMPAPSTPRLPRPLRYGIISCSICIRSTHGISRTT